MVDHITRESLQQAYYTQIDDVLYVGSLDFWNPEAMSSLDFEWQPWMAEVIPGSYKSEGVLAEAIDILQLERLAQYFTNYYLELRKEPDWMHMLPHRTQHYLRFQCLWQDDSFDPWLIDTSLPFSGFGYEVLEGGLVEQVDRAFNLGRLRHIKQLGFLHYPTIGAEGTHIITQQFPHNRYIHSMDVMVTGILILYNNNRSEWERKLYKVGSSTHDTLTPASGDTTKLIDKKEFDEDLHYPILMEQVDWSKIPDAPEDAKVLLPPMIMNKGLLGAVLDIADKIAYVSRDLREFYVHGPKLAGYEEIKALLSIDPQPTSLWECARIRDEQLYFDDKDRLINFLMVRATLFAKLYQNASCRFWENFVMTFVKRKFYETGRLTKDHLLRMVDWQLQEMINNEIDLNFVSGMIGLRDERMETFNTLETAQKRQKELLRQNRPVSMIEKAFSAGPGVHFLVETPEGLKPLSKADPMAAALIRQTIRPDYQYSLHYLDIHRGNLPSVLRDWNRWA